VREAVRMSDDDVVADGKDWLAGVFDRAAPTYDEVAGAYHEEFAVRLVDAAEVRDGDDLLDVACGRGAVLVAAAGRIGGGRLVGIDLSPEMVRLASARMLMLGIDADVRTMDAEALDLDDGSFSAVLCAFGIFFLPHPEAAVAGFRRVLAPGGRIALSTWGAEDERWAWEDDLFADVTVERRAVRRPFDQPDDLATLLADARFTDVDVHREQHEVVLADADEWWTWKWSYSLRGVLEQLAPERLDRLRREADGHIAEMSASGEPLRLRLEALVATGRRSD
jgi:ubiquinone/menaquinone biosynthesis C-methylase UbiE